MDLAEEKNKGKIFSLYGSDDRDSTLDEKKYNLIKTKVHFELVKKLRLSSISQMPKDKLANLIRDTLYEISLQERLPLNQKERSLLISDLLNEIMGLGPIEPLMQDDSVQDILVNGYSKVYVEKGGVLFLTNIRFRDNDHLMQIIDKIVSKIGRRVDESSPMVDARLDDGSRVNVVIPPISLDGSILSIRKFGKTSITMEQLLSTYSLTEEMAGYLEAAVKSKLNILISGGTGAGKTTLLNILAGYIPENERIITIEDSAELKLQQPHVVRLEARPPNIEGRGEITLRDLVRNSLRMRPDRIIVGEVRGGEVLDMLQAMNTGHPGSMSTIHANSPRDALSRMEVMLSMATSAFSDNAMKLLIGSAINIIVQLARLPDGSRRVVSISEMLGFKQDYIEIQEIFVFEQQGVDEDGKIFGEFKSTGKKSIFREHIKSMGIELPEKLFNFRYRVN